MYKVYGIPNCDTVKKAITWLKTNQIPYEFHDYKKLGISPEKLTEWIAQEPLEKLINKAGTTYKSLTDEQKQAILSNQKSAIEIMANHSSVIKRPIIEAEKIVVIGFKEDLYKSIFLEKY